MDSYILVLPPQRVHTQSISISKTLPKRLHVYAYYLNIYIENACTSVIKPNLAIFTHIYYYIKSVHKHTLII